MKIVIVGSAHSVHIRKIADNLVSKGHKVTVFSEESALTESSPQQYSEEVILFDVWPVSKKIRKISFLIKLNLYLFFKKADVVWFVYASSYGLHTKRVFTLAKKVVSVWGSDILINSYKKAYSGRISHSLNKADLIFSTSEFLRTHTRRLTSSKMILTPYGPNDSFFKSQKIAQDSRQDSLNIAKSFDKTIVCTKWLKTVYGVDILINAISLEENFFRDRNIGLLICGEGQDSAFFKKIVEEKNISDIVKFVGYQEEAHIINLLDHADLAVFPSRSESFGVSLLESFSRSVPVICSSAGGFNELSLGGRFGQIVDSLEPAEYLKAIKDTFLDGPSYDVFEAQKYAQTFSWSSCMDHMESALLALSEPALEKSIADFRSGQNLDKAIFIHCEPKVVNSNLSRARDIRIAGFRKALAKKYSVQEVFPGLLSAYKYEEMIRSIFNISNPKLIYYEGTSSMLSSFHKRYNNLKSALLVAKLNEVKFIYYLPDAHEYWDDYVISTRSATNVHFARYRKRKLLKLLVKFKAIIAYPSIEFREALFDRLNPALRNSLKKSDSIILPPAASGGSNIVLTSSLNISYVYAGGIGPFYKLQRFLISIKETPCSEDIHFFVRKNDLNNLAPHYKNLLLESDLQIKHGALPLNLGDTNPIGLLVLEPIEYISIAIPLKFYSYLERGWPILCYSNTAIGRIVQEHGLGWVIEPEVSELSIFLSSNKAQAEYASIQKNIERYIVKNQWSNRVQQLEEVKQ